MNVYLITGIASVVVVAVALVFARFKRMTFAEYSKKYEDL